MSAQPSLFDAPQPTLRPKRVRARSTDPATSHHAANSVSATTINRTHVAILRLLQQHGPQTDEDIARLINTVDADLRVSSSGLRTRRSELAGMGLVIDTRDTRPSSLGRPSIVWAATP